MNIQVHKQLLLVTLILVTALLIAACGATAPTEEPPAPSAAEEEAATQEEAAPAEEAAEAEEEPAPEAEAEEEEEPGVIDEEGVLASDAAFGTVVETDEPDVSTPRDKAGGEYRTVQSSDAVSFHPYITTDASSSGYQGLVYSGDLINVDENTLEYIPWAAESYEISDDGLTFTFHLRKDLKWSDGTPLTAQDYKWTYDQVMDPVNEYPYRSQVDFIKSYEALDDYTIQAKIDEIHAPALLNIGLFITPLPKHIWENLPWDDPEKNPEINSPSVVSGPYKLVEWQRDQYTIFEANEDYWYHGAPNITGYIIETVPDQDIAFQKLKSGEVDSSSMTPEQLEEARTLDNVTVYEWWPAQTAWTYIGLNMRDGYLTGDLNIRRGLAYAIDKELLVDEVWLGQARRLCAIYAPTTWAHNPNVPCYDYDPVQALKEFAEAGYTFVADDTGEPVDLASLSGPDDIPAGQLVDENGEQLTLRFLYGPNTSPTAELIAVTIQDYLKEVGIEMPIEALEWASFLEATDAEEPTWDMFLGGWRSGIEPHSAATVWAEENIPELNSVAYINPEMTEYFEQAGATYDREVRTEAYGKVQEIIAEDLPYITLSYRKSASAENNRIKGVEPTVLGIGWNQEDWWIEEETP
jgi:peptide/nickel transport system substrate-binding protein